MMGMNGCDGYDVSTHTVIPMQPHVAAQVRVRIGLKFHQRIITNSFPGGSCPVIPITLWYINITLEDGPVEIVDFSMNDMVDLKP